MPIVNGVMETCLYVEDLARAERFYEGLLGFPKMHGDNRFAALNIAGRDVLLLFKRGEATQPIETPGGTIPPHDGAGANHLAFAISASELKARQVTCWPCQSMVNCETSTAPGVCACQLGSVCTGPIRSMA